jgi:glucose-6-phosphate 1-dehydrogenase
MRRIPARCADSTGPGSIDGRTCRAIFARSVVWTQHSYTETYAPLELYIDNWRWARRAFLPAYRQAPTQELGKNAIVIRIQPYEGVTIRFGSKVPGGTTMEVRDVSMDFSYGRSFTESSPEAYERLILDVLLGDPPLFPTTQEVDLSWKILDPIEDFWSTLGQPQPYRAGTWGPQEAVEMLARDGHRWRMP